MEEPFLWFVQNFMLIQKIQFFQFFFPSPRIGRRTTQGVDQQILTNNKFHYNYLIWI